MPCTLAAHLCKCELYLISPSLILFSVLREEERATNLWFEDRSGGFEKIREGPPNVIDLPELEAVSYFVIYNKNS